MEKTRFDRHNWKPQRFEKIEDAKNMFEDMGSIKCISAVGVARNLTKCEKLRAFHKGLETIDVKWQDNYEIYDKYNETKIYPMKLELCEPVIIAFESGDTIELRADDEDILISKNRIGVDIVDGVNNANVNYKKYFESVIGTKITKVESSSRNAKKFPRDYIPEWYVHKIHIIWLDNGLGLFLIADRDSNYYCGLLEQYDEQNNNRKIAMTTLKQINEVTYDDRSVTIVPGHNCSSYFWIVPVKPAKEKYKKENSDYGVVDFCVEEISVEEDIVYDYLYKYLSGYFDTSIQKWARVDEWDDDPELGFEWNLEHNIFKIDQIKLMLEDIKFDMLIFDQYACDDAVKYDFYERFVWCIESMIKNTPEEYPYISFMGP